MLVALLASLMPLGVELALCKLDELPVAGDARSRDIAAGFAPGGDRASLSSGTSSGSVVVVVSLGVQPSFRSSMRNELESPCWLSWRADVVVSC
jgi:hypothetical protein